MTGPVKRLNKVKLVTHCRGANKYDAYVLKEYLAYKIYNELTDYSLRVRLLEIEYVEEEEISDAPFAALAKASLEEAKEVLTDPKAILSEWKGLASIIRLMQYRLFVEHPGAVKAMLSIYRAAH